ncbi:MAG: phage head morphogenesis protein [Oleiphilus sp.]|nr:MAG: phage head morphogenesis protein [Oleiphilus sp.]
MPIEISGVPAKEAIDNIRSKLAVPTQTWDDFLELPRSKAFTVAGATKVDLLNDLQEDLAQALEAGESISAFRKRFDRTVQKHGWTYRGKRGWRTRVIYDNNLRSARMAGRWEQIQRVKSRRPYLIYYTVGDQRVRDQHRQWHATALPVDHDWWDTHYPPNDWGCRCYVVSANEKTLKKRGISLAEEAPALQESSRVNSTTGEDYGLVPKGIGVGWNNNVGKQWLSSDIAFGEKLMRLPQSVRRAALAHDGVHHQHLSKSFSLWAAKSLRQKSQNKVHAAGWLQDDLIEALKIKDIAPSTATISISDTRLKRMQREFKKSKGKQLPIDLLHDLPTQLRKSQAVLLDKKGGLVFVLPEQANNRSGKIIVLVNFKEAGEQTNSVRSGGLVPLGSLRDEKQYELLTGEI